MSTPGRSCPLDYHYSATVFDRAADIEVDTLYVIGGLYGNYPALEAVLSLREQEKAPVTLIFNGDFNWFNVDSEGFVDINSTVLEHTALRGNVETELTADGGANGCGCGYPDWVDEAVVARSNAIMDRLRQTASAHTELRQQLVSLPMHRVARVGSLRIGIVHGDAQSLAGWGFAWEALREPTQDGRLVDYFARARVRVFACSHTCLPVIRTVSLPQGAGVIANNGAAGMPNFHGTHHGMITRIGTRPWTQRTLYGVCLEGVHIQALPLHYDHARWVNDFLTNWPPQSPAYASYFQRIVHGPDFQPRQATLGDRDSG